MKRITLLLVLIVTVGWSPLARAQEPGDDSPRIAVGYAFSQFLEEGGGSTPLGFYFTGTDGGEQVGFAIDVAYHRGTGDREGLHTGTLAIGPRKHFGGGGVAPFVHVLGGVRYDEAFGQSNVALGGMVGGGADIPVSQDLHLRLGADFQIFFDEGTNVKTLRLTAGIAF